MEIEVVFIAHDDEEGDSKLSREEQAAAWVEEGLMSENDAQIYREGRTL